MVPRMVLEGMKMIPDELLQCMRCACNSVTACKTKKCGCTRNGLACSTFCVCEGGQLCCNERNRYIENDNEMKDDDHDDEDEL